MTAMQPALVLYAHDLAATRQFYETLNLVFVEERHGDGPIHYACAFEGFVLELYPQKDGVPEAKPCQSMALVLFVEDFEPTLAGLKAMGMKPGATSIYLEARGLHAASVRDPDGRLVRILERDPRDI